MTETSESIAGQPRRRGRATPGRLLLVVPGLSRQTCSSARLHLRSIASRQRHRIVAVATAGISTDDPEGSCKLMGRYLQLGSGLLVCSAAMLRGHVVDGDRPKGAMVTRLPTVVRSRRGGRERVPSTRVLDADYRTGATMLRAALQSPDAARDTGRRAAPRATRSSCPG